METLGAKIIQAPEVEEKPEVAAEVAQMEQILEMKPIAGQGELEAESSPFEVVDSLELKKEESL